MDMAQDALRCLQELAELGMGHLRRVDALAGQTDDVQVFLALTEAHCDLSRSVRQSIALSLRIQAGAFAASRPTRELAEREPREPSDAESGERGEYERPDWNIPGVRLDQPLDEPALEAAVVHIRTAFARAESRLQRRAPGLPPLRLVDSS
jgi:hypothetical protein